MRPLERLLFDVFKGQGAANPAKLAKLAADSFDHDQRDRKIYELRARLTEDLVAERFGISTKQVRRIVSVQLKLRRIA